jgi:uncharacterized protein (DUF697 family)
VSKKSLPRAIQPATPEAREASAVPGIRERKGAPTGASAGDGSAVGAPVRASDHDLVETASAPQAASAPAAAVASAASTGAETNTSQRRSLAQAIVERHAAYAAVGGIIPVPIVNVASITAVIVRMVKVLSGLYGVPFERDRARAIVIGLMGGTMPTGLAAVTSSTLVALVPASGLIGLAVSSVTAIACTRGIGRIFIEHFEGGATLLDLPKTEKK